MADTYTSFLRMRIKEPGSLFTQREQESGVDINNWATALNRDLENIDAVIGEVCSPDQIAAIREKLRDQFIFLGRQD